MSNAKKSGASATQSQPKLAGRDRWHHENMTFTMTQDTTNVMITVNAANMMLTNRLDIMNVMLRGNVANNLVSFFHPMGVHLHIFGHQRYVFAFL